MLSTHCHFRVSVSVYVDNAHFELYLRGSYLLFGVFCNFVCALLCFASLSLLPLAISHNMHHYLSWFAELRSHISQNTLSNYADVFIRYFAPLQTVLARHQTIQQGTFSTQAEPQESFMLLKRQRTEI